MADPLTPAPLPPPPAPPSVPIWQNKYVGGALTIIALVVAGLNEGDVFQLTGKAHALLSLASTVLAALGYAGANYKSKPQP